MQEEKCLHFFTRREALMAAAAVGLSGWSRLYASDAEFWNKKAPADWSAEEVTQLTTKSPWSKEVTGEFSRGEGGGGSMGGGGGQGGGGGWGGRGGGMGGGGGWGGMGGGRGGSRGGGRQSSTPPTGTVRWESAKPVRDALKTPLPDAFANRYVISVSGFPLSGRHRRQDDDDQNQSQSGDRTRPSEDEILDRIKSATSLEPKDKAVAQPGLVQKLSDDSTTLLFGFSKEILTLHPGDKEVTFLTRLGPVAIKAKFNLKEMLYHGELAI